MADIFGTTNKKPSRILISAFMAREVRKYGRMVEPANHKFYFGKSYIKATAYEAHSDGHIYSYIVMSDGSIRKPKKVSIIDDTGKIIDE